MEKTSELKSDSVEELIARHSGIHLDIGCGASKQEGFVGMDIRSLPGVDIVHDWNDMPWPLPDESCKLVMASHVVEHVNPADGHFIRWMDEVWRIAKYGGRLVISCPHGSSQGFLQDPTHINACNEATWAYFTPENPLYTIYKPKPWKLDFLTFDPSANIEVALTKIKEEGDNGQPDD